MAKEAMFSMKLEPELRAEFMAAAESVDRPASQILREFMREFISARRENLSYQAFLTQSVEAGRRSLRAGKGISNADVEVAMREKRQQLLSRSV